MYPAVWVLQLTSQSKKQKSTKSCAIINIIPNTGAGFEDHVDHVPFFQFKNKCIGQADITSVVVHVVALGNSLAVVIQQNTQHLWDTCVPPIESEVVHSSERGGEDTCTKGETQCTSLNWNTLLKKIKRTRNYHYVTQSQLNFSYSVKARGFISFPGSCKGNTSVKTQTKMFTNKMFLNKNKYWTSKTTHFVKM